MTDEQINVTIATYLGWQAVAFNEGIGVIGIPPARNECDPIHLKSVMWTADLNAMHEAEKVLDGVHSWNGEEHHCNAEEAYMGHLTDIIVRNSGQKISDDWQLVCATARQRAEAFLRTLGKWNQSGDATEMEVQK